MATGGRRLGASYISHGGEGCEDGSGPGLAMRRSAKESEQAPQSDQLTAQTALLLLTCRTAD